MITDKQIEVYRNPHCEQCHGEGVFTFYDSVPYGNTNVLMEGSEVCECVSEGLTARDEVVESLTKIIRHYPDVSRETLELIIEEVLDMEF